MLKYIVSSQYDFDLNAPIEVQAQSLAVNSNFEASPLEAAAFDGQKNLFQLLIDCGAKLDLKAPYLPLLFIRHKTDVGFFEYLQKLGAGKKHYHI